MRRPDREGLDSESTVLTGTLDDVAYLRTPSAIRARSAKLFERALAGDSSAFSVHRAELDRVAEYVARVAGERATGLPAAIHGRMRHFDAGGKRRTKMLDERLASLPREERARAKIDLIVPSVLLDAGAGDTWAFTEDDVRIGRSEGLAVASLHLFLRGGLSGDGQSLRTDAEGLVRIDAARVIEAFQVSPENKLVGVDGRAALLARLGRALAERPLLFGADGRPGHLFDALAARSERGSVRAVEVLGVLLEGLSSIWPGRFAVADQNLGDAWPHPALGDGTTAASLIPFHKLSQWLTHSLVEPLQEGGLHVVGLEELSGLSEYRSGGLLLDLGVLSLRDPSEASRIHRASDPLVVEWRALTVSLLDQLEPLVRAKLRLSSDDPESAGLFGGGVWAAGRKIAHEKRPCAGSPLALESDGTVF